jgi:hypothetical protein
VCGGAQRERSRPPFISAHLNWRRDGAGSHATSTRHKSLAWGYVGQ